MTIANDSVEQVGVAPRLTQPIYRRASTQIIVAIILGVALESIRDHIGV